MKPTQANPSDAGPEESYGLCWPGKQVARRMALSPGATRLRPCPQDSLDWDSTRNVLIEGDNLDALKQLQTSHAGRVKMIYIDPPYNTGKHFTYADHYQGSARGHSEITGTAETGSRLHGDWLNMIYPRLMLARELLRPDGVIFISIDDNELANLRLIGDEIFGPEQFCGVIKRRAARKPAFLSKRMTDMCDYVVIYVRSELAAPLSAGQVRDGTRPVLNTGNPQSLRILRAGAEARCVAGVYPAGHYAASSLRFELLDDLVVANGKVCHEVRIRGPWRINQDMLDKTLFVTRRVGLRRTMLPEELEQSRLLSDLLDDPNCYNEKGSEEVGQLLGEGVFSNPKPRGLIEALISAAGVGGEDIVLDFFAGSGTTGHAVMARNAADGARRSFILAQQPEALDTANREQRPAVDFCDRIHSPRTIAELTKERLRRAARQVGSETPSEQLDLGFRVYRLEDGEPVAD